MNESNTFKTKPLVAAISGAIMCAVPMVNAQMAAESATTPTLDNIVPRGGAVLLYDQTNDPFGNGLPDQDFEAMFDAYDAEGADDFVVTDPTGWSITQVDIIGTQSTTGPANTVNITFYGDNAGTPDTSNVLCDYTGLATVDTTGSLSTTLPTPCDLPGSTTYWLRHQTQQDFGTAGQHFWSNRATISGAPAHWRNIQDGFGLGCTDFADAGLVCSVGGGMGTTSYDLLFALSGSVGLDADLTVGVTNNAVQPVQINDVFQYAVTATNNGPAAATGVVVTSDLSLNSSYVSDDCGASAAGNTVTWMVGNLANGASQTCNITVQADGVGSLSNSATVTGDQNDPNGGNNAGSNALAGPAQTIPSLNWLGISLMTVALLWVARRKITL